MAIRFFGSSIRLTTCILLMLGAVAAKARGQCGHWASGFETSGLDYGAYVMTVFDDDGDGPHAPALYIGGGSQTAGGMLIPYIAKWDGISWGDVGGGTDGIVHALLAFDDDGIGPNPAALYAGGNFSHAGGITALSVARWDGTMWAPLGSGIGGAVTCLAVFDDDGLGPHPPALFAGGIFGLSGTWNIAKWDGIAWSPVGTGAGTTGDTVTSMAVFDDDADGPHLPALYVGGDFVTAGGATVNRVAKWDGQSWTAVGGGTNNAVLELRVFDDDGDGPHVAALYCGGKFTTAGGLLVNCVAKWDGIAWSALGSGVSGAGSLRGIYELRAFDNDGNGPESASLIASGRFTSAGGVTAYNIARWNGAAWLPLGPGLTGGTSAVGNGADPNVTALGVFDDDGAGPHVPLLYTGGYFSIAGSQSVDNVARWDGTNWSSFGDEDHGVSGTVYALSLFASEGNPNTNSLIVAGLFTGAGGQLMNNVANWNGTNWTPLGSGTNGLVRALAVFDDDGSGPHDSAIYAAGDFTSAGGQSANRIAKWDGTSWSALGAGLNNGVLALAVFDADGDGPAIASLYAGGYFTTAGGVTANRVARWDGVEWSSVGGGMNNTVLALAVHDEDGAGPGAPALFASGGFSLAGGQPANKVARWNGSLWTNFGSGLNSAPASLCSFDEDGDGPNPPALYVAGGYIARWTGTSWSALPNGPDSFVYTLGVYDDDGAGPRLPVLVAGGSFHGVGGGDDAGHIARWNGLAWSSFETGMLGGGDAAVRALAVIDDDGGGPERPVLFAGGGFTIAGDVPSYHIARWVPTDLGDTNGDGSIDEGDIAAFASALVSGADSTCGADVNQDGLLDGRDCQPFVDLLLSIP